MALSVNNLLLESFSSDFDPLQPSLFKDLPGDESADMKTKGKESTEDVWKNFSFPPTPPISPACSPPYTGTDEAREQPVCQGLDEGMAIDEECSFYFQPGDLKDILIKDCMWNGAAFEKATDRKQRLHSKMERVRLLSQTPPLSESAARILSVDPAEIFPFPLSSGPSDELRENIDEQSDSEEEEVEVDVVSIENSIKREEPAEECEIIEQESEKSCPSPDTLQPLQDEIPSEFSLEETEDLDDEQTDFVGKIRTRRHRKALSTDGLNYREGKKLIKNITSSGESDESENDSEFTRATHNVLERKRRNDLKLKFQKLRDCVPELKDNERAPKVSILRKSWEFISRIKQDEVKLSTELEKQKKINAVLLRKLLALNQAN